MSRNMVQFQKGLSDARFDEMYGSEDATQPSFNCAGPMDLNVQTVAGTAIAS